MELNGVIGWDITASMVRDKIKECSGDLHIKLSSPGGFIYEGIEIHNAIRSYAENNNVTITVTGIAASMASYILTAVKKENVFFEDNAVLMIHNAWSSCTGDYREMGKEAQELESITAMLAKAYSKWSGLQINVIRKMMDAETWLYGDDVLKEGFCGGIVDREEELEYDIDGAKAFYNVAAKKLKDDFRFKEDFQRAAYSTKKDTAGIGLDKELRTNKEKLNIDNSTLDGIAVKYGAWSDDLGGWRERIMQGAFSESIKSADIVALNNHDLTQPLGRIKNATLALSDGPEYLTYSVKLDSTGYAEDLKKSVARGDVLHSSFTFMVLKDTWNKDYTERTILQARLYEVGPCTMPAYPDTSVSIRALCEGAGISYKKLGSVLRKAKSGQVMPAQELELYEKFKALISGGKSEVASVEESALADKSKQIDLEIRLRKLKGDL